MKKLVSIFEFTKPGSILNYIRKTMGLFAGYLITGQGVRAIFKKIWGGIWKEIDRILGFFSREIYKHSVKIVPNKVFFFTQEMRYCCNPKYICEELLRRNEDVEIVWRIPDKASKKGRGGVPDCVKGVRAGSFSYYKEIYSANIIVANSYIFLDQVLLLKKNQTLLQTWHGSLGIKKFGKEDMKGRRRQLMATILTGKMSDYCITNSTFVSGSLRNTFWKKTPMLEYGHPRNDIMFDNYSEKRAEIKNAFLEKHELSPEIKFVMYAPTFRDDKQFDCYNIDFERLTTALSEHFGGEWCVLLRFHPSLRKVYKERKKKYSECNCSIIDVTDYHDMQELITIADIAITDYSSWIYDFMLQKRPGFIFATDIELYNNERGFCYPLETTPFPIATDNDSLIDCIHNFNNETYLENLETFLDEKGCVEDGHASERVVDKIFELISSTEQKNSNKSQLKSAVVP